MKTERCETCIDRANEERRNRFYCRECGEIMTKITKSKTKYCRECGQAYIEYSIECPKKNSFWAGLLWPIWGFHDSEFLKYENLPRRK